MAVEIIAGKKHESVNLAGKECNWLTVLEFAGHSKKKQGTRPYWKCQCRCGKILLKRQEDLLNLSPISCGCKPLPRVDPEERFWKFVNKTETCWVWTGGRQSNGYGIFGLGGRYGKKIAAHRFAYQSMIGEIPSGHFICHRCDNPLCVRPDHLFAGTHADNMGDMVRKNRSTKGRRVGGALNTTWAENHWSRTRPEKVRRGEAAPGAKIREVDVLDIRQSFASGAASVNDLAAKYGLNHGYVRLVIAKKRWKHIA